MRGEGFFCLDLLVLLDQACPEQRSESGPKVQKELALKQGVQPVSWHALFLKPGD
jgi:hypothetical protein